MPGRLPIPAGDAPPFRVAYAAASDDRTGQRRLADDVLAVIDFSTEPPEASDAPVVRVPLVQIGAERLQEVWRSPQPVTRGVHDGIRFTRNDAVLFGHLRLGEDGGGTLEALTGELYHRVFAAVRALGYPHVWRMWNFFADINGSEAGLERYRAFVRGRHSALSPVLPRFEQSLPAATAIGCRVPGIVVCFLAATEPAQQVENPRQVSAFRYPLRYGPKSPSFSRAVLKQWGGDAAHLYISGTASIVGDESRHPGQPEAQITEVLDNVEALLAAAAARTGAPLHPSLLRFYLRDPGHADLVAAAAARRFGPVPVMLLEGAICRTDLLLEVEGMAVSAEAETSG